MNTDYLTIHDVGGVSLWELDIEEVTGHNLEAKGREEVNQMLQEGWVLLHTYTLRYREDEAWRERPMAILGKPRNLIEIVSKERSKKSH